eukprot:2045603-Amphidinium_carterae.1
MTETLSNTRERWTRERWENELGTDLGVVDFELEDANTEVNANAGKVFWDDDTEVKLTIARAETVIDKKTLKHIKTIMPQELLKLASTRTNIIETRVSESD